MFNWKEFKNKKICVAVSGGADSVALLHYCKAREKELGYSLSAVHCEHGIRGEESLEDMRFVQAICAAWEIPLRVFREDCPLRASREKESLETAARNFRYGSFSALLEEGAADFIATAHHLGDEAETVLFRMARGSALAGASAIKPKNGGYIRPFLDWSKGEILAYIQANGLTFREDFTNAQTDATRNKLRLEILPKLEEAIPGAAENIARFATLAAEDDALLYEWSEKLLVGEDTVQRSDKKPLFTRACLLVMKGLGLRKDYTSAHLSALYELQSLPRGSQVTLPQGLRAERVEKGVRFFFGGEEDFLPQAEEKSFDLEGYDGGRYEVNLSFAPQTAAETPWKILRFDVEKIPAGATFRFRREGDYIQRFGGGKKSLKKFFNEEKTPVREREYLPLIAVGSEVYAVCGVEISEKVKIDEGTKRVAYLSIRKKER